MRGGAPTRLVDKPNAERCSDCACATCVADIMSRDVTFCHPTDLLSDVWEIKSFSISGARPELETVGRAPMRATFFRSFKGGEGEQLLLRDYALGVGYR